ncbi:melanoma inhibitory activity protein 3 isoform X3, partial [Sigmodon hispidus]
MAAQSCPQEVSSQSSCPYTMDSVPATVPAVIASPGDPALLGPLSVLYRTLIAKLLELIASLLDNVQPGPDFYGLPWQPVIITMIVGIVSFTIFFWRNILV